MCLLRLNALNGECGSTMNLVSEMLFPVYANLDVYAKFMLNSAI